MENKTETKIIKTNQKKQQHTEKETHNNMKTKEKEQMGKQHT